MENGDEWMAIKPNEIETMKPLINRVRGRVQLFELNRDLVITFYRI